MIWLVGLLQTHWAPLLVPIAAQFAQGIARQKVIDEAQNAIGTRLRSNLKLAVGQIVILIILCLGVWITSSSLLSRLLASAYLWVIIIYNVAHFLFHTLPELKSIKQWWESPLIKFAMWWASIRVADVIAEMSLILLAIILLGSCVTRWLIGSTFGLIQPWLELYAGGAVMEEPHGKYLIFSHIALSTLPVWLELILGILMGVFVFLTNHYLLNNKSTDISKKRAVVYHGIFFAGFVYPLTQPIDLSLYHGVLLMSAFATNFALAIWEHYRMKKGIAEDRKAFLLFRKMAVRPGYIESSDPRDKDNAYSSRFGLHVLGVRSDRSWWDWLRGRDGWTHEERSALLGHETGHTIAATLAIFLETLMFYYFFTNMIFMFPASLLLLPTFVSMVTLISWFDELLADSWAGPKGFELKKRVFAKLSWRERWLGGIGACSHPPLFLRSLAFANPYITPILLLTLVVICVFLYLK